MPIFQLPDSHEMIAQELTGIMLFPKSLKNRRRLRNAFLMEFAHELLDKNIGSIQEPDVYKKNLKRHIPSQIIISQAAKELGHGPTLVGAMLLLTLGTESKVASLNLSTHALDYAYKNKKIGTSKRKMETLWKKYQAVAHFWAAHQIWITPGAISNTKVLEGFPCHSSQVMLFLSIAEYLRRKGESFQSPRSPNGRYLLDKKQTFRVAPANRLGRMTDKDFNFDKMYKFLPPILKERKRYRP